MLRLLPRRRLRLVAAAVPMALTAAACGGSGDERTLDVFAASSLTDAFEELAEAFEEREPDVEVRLNLAGSSRLREQIVQGAPADVFVSADESNMAAVVAAGAVTEPTTLARNRMIIGVPAGNPGGVTGLTDLARPELLVGRCAAGVPCGELARAVLADAAVAAAVDTEEADVRALVTRLSVGELDAGLVYVTDVVATADVDGVTLPDGIDRATTYVIAPLVASPEGADAAAFVAFVLSPGGQAVLAAHGFEPR